MIDPSPSDIFQTGQILNNTYEIEGVLGRGGTGEVYKAHNLVTGRVFAIKALNSRFSGKADYIELMKREEAIRTIVHDAVVRYNECSRTDDGRVYLVMDYISGDSLADIMERRRLEPREILIVAHRIAEGLGAAHGHGIVHRDLSPDNIILRDGQPEEAVLIDFGIAKDTAEGARTIVGDNFAGKYEYAAPEQLDGNTDARSDFYALGATLLAAHRGETPHLGTTPGEIVRRKQHPLDLDDVPEPLRELIGRLSAPDPGERPSDAGEVVALIERFLRPATHRQRGRTTPERRGRSGQRERRRRPVGAILAVAVLLAGGGAAWVYRDLIIPPPVPVASPFTVSASVSRSGEAALEGYAPDEAAAARLAAAFAAATGAPPDAARLEIAQGVPGEGWTGEVAELIETLAPLEFWELSVSDLQGAVTGLASDGFARDRITEDLDQWRRAASIELQTRLQAGPEVLSVASLASELDVLATCGPLSVPGDDFPLGATVPVRGNVADNGDEAAIRDVLEPMIGSRTLDVVVTALNSEVCAIRQVLPSATDSAVSVWLGNGDDGSANLTGIYTTGQNPVAEVRIPASIGAGFLWVMIVDNTGLVFNALPNERNLEQRIEHLGRVEGGVRSIPILHPISALAEDPSRIAVRVTEGNYGVSEIVVILSAVPLFDLRRPREESVASAAQALEEALEGREDRIIGIAYRRIEARP